jgi:NADH:ubiquinone oxidoreductase subunit C
VNAYDRLPDAVAVAELFGEDATAERAYELLTVDVPPASWIAALETARSELGCTFFDWLSAVDEQGTGFRVCAHVAALGGGTVRGLLIRTTVPHEAAVLPTAIGVYAGAGWHERETHEMFGIEFTDHPNLIPLLLPETFEGHPLRKDFVLAARVAKAWPGAKEPGESEHGGPKRRQMLPPGVPDPNEWGPLKGQLPPAPARPARGTAAAGERPVRRARSVSGGSASQQTPGSGSGSESTAGKGEKGGTADTAPPTSPSPATDAPWHNPKPAFGDGTEEPTRKPDPSPEPGSDQESDPGPNSTPGPAPDPEPDPGPDSDRPGGDA